MRDAVIVEEHVSNWASGRLDRLHVLHRRRRHVGRDQRDVARRLGEEHEAHEIRARIQCGVHGFWRGKPANLDVNHGAARPKFSVPQRLDQQRR